MLAALDAGAEDIDDQGDTWQVTTAPTDLHAVRDRARGGRDRGHERRPHDAADQTRRRSTDAAAAQVGAAGDRRARGARRRAERLRQLRHPRRRPRDGGGMSGPRQPGDPAPDFTLPGVEKRGYGATSRCRTYRGRKVALAFYPGDSTRRLHERSSSRTATTSQEFEDAGAVVLAISPQDVDSKERWSEREHFPFPLLADTEKTVIDAVRRRITGDRGQAHGAASSTQRVSCAGASRAPCGRSSRSPRSSPSGSRRSDRPDVGARTRPPVTGHG